MAHEKMKVTLLMGVRSFKYIVIYADSLRGGLLSVWPILCWMCVVGKSHEIRQVQRPNDKTSE